MPRTSVTPKLFDAVKIMTKGGATIPEIMEYFDLSSSTISRIRASENFTEYKNIIAARAIGAKKQAIKPTEPVNEVTHVEPITKTVEPQIIEHRQSVTIQATHYMMEELRKLNETMTLISNKLAFIVEQLS